MSVARPLYKQGFEHFAKGDLSEAVALYRRAIEADPAFALAWNGLSMALARQGELPAAIEAAQKLVELEPDDPLSHTNLSRLLQQNGQIPEAEEARARAMQLQMQQQAG
jgi:Flp pilus assembly protein TadD